MYSAGARPSFKAADSADIQATFLLHPSSSLDPFRTELSIGGELRF